MSKEDRKCESVAIIMDGNGRWAKAQGKERTYGHMVGAENVETICRAADSMGIKYLTVYAFSTENWKRSQMEVDIIMGLIEEYVEKCFKLSEENNMRVRFIGDMEALSDSLRTRMRELTEFSSRFTGFTFTIAINYGSRDEILRAIERLRNDPDAPRGKLSEEEFSSYLDTREIPDPDLLIRTGGEKRLSNYLMWQLSYTEFMFSDLMWPEFTPEELARCISEYNMRNRRFGGV